MTSLSEVYPSKWLKSEDLNGKEVTATIAKHTFEEMPDGQSKLTIWFVKSDKGLILNKTNATRISIMYGETLEDWAGKPIILYEEYVDFGGRSVPAIRVKVTRQQGLGAAVESENPADGMDQEKVIAEIGDDDDGFEDEIPFS